jgi:hypothetical protein
MEIERIVVHHSASHPGSTTLELIDMWHQERGFKRVGYQIVIEGGGELRLGRPLDKIGAHVKGHNIGSIGICVTGDNTREGYEWRKSQMTTLVGTIGLLRQLYDAELPVLRHCDLADTLCPGLSEEAWNELRAQWGDVA